MPAVKLPAVQARIPDGASLRSRIGSTYPVAWLYRLYAGHLVRRRIEDYPDRLVRHSYGGHELQLSLEDPVAADWYDHDWPLMPELVLLGDSRLRAGARVFDLGAHQGVVALMLSRQVGPSGSVIAVEAERHNAEVARRNARLNHAENLQIIHAAAASHDDGSLAFREGLNGQVASQGRFGLSQVPALSIDGLAERHGPPDVVFIDIEGYEEQALIGARRTLAEANSDFFVEVHVGHGLETLGGSARSVIDHFDPERFDRFTSPALGELQEYAFTELAPEAGAPADRFFLVARGRGTATSEPD